MIAKETLKVGRSLLKSTGGNVASPAAAVPREGRKGLLRLRRPRIQWSVEREIAAKPWVATFTLVALLVPQVLLPGIGLSAMDNAQAQNAKAAQAKSTPPAWYQEARRREAQGAVRLAQRPADGPTLSKGPSTKASKGSAVRAGIKKGRVAGSKPGQHRPSAPLYESEPRTTPLALKLDKEPTETEIIMAGQECSPLVPNDIADVNEKAEFVDSELRRVGIPQGLKAQAAPNTPAGQLLSEGRSVIQDLRDANLDFARAIDLWNRKKFKEAVQAFHTHLEKYPESPWSVEAMLHIADEAMCTSRYEEASGIYEEILKVTNKTRPRNTGNVSTDRKGRRLHELYNKTFEKLAGSEVMTGQYQSAGKKLRNILKNDYDWRRRTWASHWLQRVHMFQDNPRELHTCGGNALGIMLVNWGKDKAAAEANALRPPRNAGFNLAELSDVTRKAGIPTRGFHVEPGTASSLELLAALPTPFLIHVNNVKKPEAPAKVASTVAKPRIVASALKKPKTQAQAKVVSCPPAANPKAAAQPMACCPGHGPAAAPAAASILETPENDGHGHFFVVLGVDQKRQEIQVINPRSNQRSTFTFAEMGNEWSGYGLARTSAPDGKKVDIQTSATKSPTRIAWLSDQQMKTVVGGCLFFGANSGLGGGRNNRNVRQSDCYGEKKSPGEPTVAINQVSVNMFVTDTPIWYDTPIGPSVDVTVSYNSQDSNTVNNAFGNKWMWNYGTYLSVNPAGTVILYSGDGRQDVYTPNGNGTFFGEAGNFNTLVKTGTYAYELRTQGGEKMIYGIPAGISSQRPVLLQVKDRWANALTMGYTLSGSHVNLTSITDAQSKVTILTYDANGHVVQVTDPFERVAKFAYDVNGNLTDIVDIEGHAFTYSYDANVQIEELGTAQGPWSFDFIDYDPGDPDPNDGVPETVPYSHAIEITDPMGGVEAYGYESHAHYAPAAGGKAYFHVDQNGDVTYSRVNSIIDGKGNITETVLPNGDTYSITYNTVTNMPSSSTDVRGKTTHVVYNGQGRVAAVTDSRGRTTSFTFAANGLDVTSWQDAAGNGQGSVQYNAYHQPTEIVDAANFNTSFTYTAWGALSTATNEYNQIAIYNYDATSKRLTSVGHKASSVATEQTLSSYTYDSVGRVRTATDAAGVTLQYDYNNLGAVTRVTYPDDTYSAVEYVCCGMPGLVRDRSGRTSYYDYDPLKRLTRAQDAAGQSVEYRYDAAGNLLELLDAKGKSTKWQYDKLDRVTKKIYADGGTQQYAYAQGLLTQMQNPRGGVIGFAYDDVANLTGIDYPNSPDASFTYDTLDRMTQMVDGTGTTNWAYNDLGVLLQEAGPWANDDVDYGYDQLWRRDAMEINGGNGTSYVYDALGRLDGLSSPSGTWDYTYAGNTGMLSQITNPNTTKSIYSYDALERLTNVANKKSTNANLSNFAYEFDEVTDPQRDVRTAVEKTIGANPTQRVAYAYDGVNQLTGEVTTEGVTTLSTKSFAYDAMGNRTASSNATATDTTSTTYAPNRLNQYTGLSSSWGGGANTTASTLGYDKSGNLTQWTSTATGGGSAFNTEYTYDDADRLIAVVKKNPTTLANTDKTEFVYDGLSRLRVSKEYTWNGTAWVVVANSEKRRVYDGMDVVQERDSGNNATIQYTRDGNIGGLLAKKAGGVNYFFHYDGSGNVVGLTDSTQASVADYSYDAYGNLLSSSGTQVNSNAYRYSTKEYFGSVGLYNYGYRFYSPGMGRWINRDPIKEQGGVNLYTMVGNDPVNSLDFYGLQQNETAQNQAEAASGTDLDGDGDVADRPDQNASMSRPLPQFPPPTTGSVSSGGLGAAVGNFANWCYRSMRGGSNGTPQTGPSARSLGARPNTDIPVKDGMVEPNTGGVSVSPGSPRNLPSHRRPPELGGTGKDPVWRINTKNLPEGLNYRPDPKSPGTHGFIEPSDVMSFNQYQELLSKTGHGWRRTM